MLTCLFSELELWIAAFEQECCLQLYDTILQSRYAIRDFGVHISSILSWGSTAYRSLKECWKWLIEPGVHFIFRELLTNFYNFRNALTANTLYLPAAIAEDIRKVERRTPFCKTFLGSIPISGTSKYLLHARVVGVATEDPDITSACRFMPEWSGLPQEVQTENLIIRSYLKVYNFALKSFTCCRSVLLKWVAITMFPHCWMHSIVLFL